MKEAQGATLNFHDGRCTWFHQLSKVHILIIFIDIYLEFILKPVWRKRSPTGCVLCPNSGPPVGVPNVVEGAEVAKAMLVEQLGSKTKEGDGDDAEDGNDDRQWKLHAIALPGNA